MDGKHWHRVQFELNRHMIENLRITKDIQKAIEMFEVVDMGMAVEVFSNETRKEWEVTI